MSESTKQVITPLYMDHSHPAVKAAMLTSNAWASCLADLRRATNKVDRAKAVKAVECIESVHARLHCELKSDSSAWIGGAL